ncbi:MAG TPA: efflux RND transporter periplasmic adaptor subunit, partial [Coriobacteriia bacterium]
TARASLTATYTVMLKGRASLRTQIKAIEALIAQPGGPPPHIPPYPILLAGMKNAEAGLSAGISAVHTALGTMNAGLVKIATGLSQMDSGLHQLRDAHRLAVVGIEAQDAAVRLAQARRDTATITSPVSGVVTFVQLPGTAVMVGAPLVRIRPDAPTRIDTYLTTDQLLQVAVGTPATVDFDSNPGGPLAGHVAVIGSTAVVPPTGFPTAIVHMTRAVKVTIELDGGATAPAGTPVDVDIRTGSVR